MASKVGKTLNAMQFSRVSGITENSKSTTLYRMGIVFPLLQLFPISSAFVFYVTPVPLALSGNFGWVDHVKLVILKVALKSKKCGHPCPTCSNLVAATEVKNRSFLLLLFSVRQLP